MQKPLIARISGGGGQWLSHSKRTLKCVEALFSWCKSRSTTLEQFWNSHLAKKISSVRHSTGRFSLRTLFRCKTYSTKNVVQYSLAPCGRDKASVTVFPSTYNFGTCLLYTSPSPRDA